MGWSLAKLLIAGGTIGFTSWFAGKRPVLAVFLIALPLASILALLFNYTEFKDPAKTVAFAKGIFYGVPLSLLFLFRS